MSLHFVIQPIIGRCGEPIAHEALTRIPGRSIGAYINQLEAAPSPTPLYHFQIQVIEQVCLALQVSPERTPTWINLSQRSLLSEAYLSHIAHLVKTAPITPSRIGLELTETYPIPNPAILATRLAFLAKNLEHTDLILDDFADCYLSHQRLDSFNFNFVKLSHSFITCKVITSPGRKELSKAIQAITDRGAKVIAEGIEHKAHHDILKKMGCFAFQGFLFPAKKKLAL